MNTKYGYDSFQQFQFSKKGGTNVNNGTRDWMTEYSESVSVSKARSAVDFKKKNSISSFSNRNEFFIFDALKTAPQFFAKKIYYGM